MAYQCPTCPKKVRGKKKGQCKECRIKYPFESSREGTEPFSRVKLKDGKKK